MYIYIYIHLYDSLRNRKNLEYIRTKVLLMEQTQSLKSEKYEHTNHLNVQPYILGAFCISYHKELN